MAVFPFGHANAATDSEAPSVSAAVSVTRLERTAIAEKVMADGVVRSDSISSRALHFGNDVVVGAVWVHEGETVTRGQKLFHVTPTRKTRQAYDNATAALHYARSEMARLKRLKKQGLAGNSQYEQARNALASARANQAALRDAGTPRTVQAPFAGVITNLSLTPGAVLAAGTAALKLASGDRVADIALLPEHAEQVKNGDAVSLQDVFNPEARCQGRVVTVGQDINSTTYTIPVTADIARDCPSLRIGGAVAATIYVSKEQALTVPRAAVLDDDQGHYIYLVIKGRASKRYVETGIKDGEAIAINGDVKAGQTVVVKGNYELSDGMAVRVAQ
ncbi:MAG: efflux RND transporter periplasmic adaptor subunit [Alcanivorax sp.]|nr:efflux RND transporter periplasmic adaptor subunit [Alcanivorax sp.]